MTNLKMCRICLNTKVKLFNYNKYHLKNYYEQILTVKVSERDDLPCYFCYECSAMLHKFHKFREKCYNGQKVLKEILCKRPITIQSISEIDRKNTNLESSINIMLVNRRVKTYRIKSQKPKLYSPIVMEDIEVVSLKDDHMDPSYDYENRDIPDNTVLESKDINEEDNIIEHINIIPKIENEDTANIIPEIPVNECEVVDEFVSDDEKLLIAYKITATKDVKEKGNRKKKNKSTGNKKKRKDEKQTKAKKFEVKDKKKTDFDSNNWLKLNLTEEEAVEEFRARGQHKRYLSAEFKCVDCFRGFSKEDMLNRHNKLRHDMSVGPIECRFCHMRFKWKCFLNKHMRQHYTRYKCLRCDLVCPLETTALFHEEYHNGVIRKCKHCGEEFKHLTTYYTHLRTHRSEHVCTLCGASFVSAIGLGIHKKIKHVTPQNEITQGEDEYCERCDIRFETKKAYEEHLIHSAKHVDGLDDLEEHLLAPSNPKKRRQTLKRHTRIPTDCHICGKHFATQAACRKHHLAEHPRTSFFAPNERHICEVCGLSLAPGSVSSHLNIHTREKLYTCKTCGRQFSSKGGMITHQLTHTSEKPVACTLCDKRFKQISSMRLHYRTFHLKEPYPKRNRKKKSDELSKMDEYIHEVSDENMALDRWR